MRSYVYFRGRAGINLPFARSARLQIGDHSRVAALKGLKIGERPILSAWLPETHGVLDDHFEGWFLSYEAPPEHPPEGLESVVGLGLGKDWLPPPER